VQITVSFVSMTDLVRKRHNGIIMSPWKKLSTVGRSTATVNRMASVPGIPQKGYRHSRKYAMKNVAKAYYRWARKGYFGAVLPTGGGSHRRAS
jgi:hypothetical protein